MEANTERVAIWRPESQEARTELCAGINKRPGAPIIGRERVVCLAAAVGPARVRPTGLAGPETENS